MKFGFDVSGVLCDYRNRAKPGAIDTIGQLRLLGHSVFSISGGEAIDKNAQRGVLQDFIDQGVAFDHSTWLCRFKADVCADFAIDMFFDDDLFNLRGIAPPTQGVYVEDANRTVEIPPGLVVVKDWDGIRSAIAHTAGVQF